MQSHSWFPTSSLITPAIIQGLYPSSLHLASGFRMSVSRSRLNQVPLKFDLLSHSVFILNWVWVNDIIIHKCMKWFLNNASIQSSIWMYVIPSMWTTVPTGDSTWLTSLFSSSSSSDSSLVTSDPEVALYVSVDTMEMWVLGSSSNLTIDTFQIV